MEFLTAWLLIAAVQLAATLSPGPAFAMALRNALAYDRRAGIFTAIGLGAGVGAHVLFVLCGLAFILSQSVFLFTAIKYIGAAYLLYVGSKALFAKKAADEENAGQNLKSALQEQPAGRPCSDLKALRMGFLTNLLNPKAVIFFTAVFTQFIDPHTPTGIVALYGATSVVIEIGWFATLALILTHKSVKARFMRISHWIERVCGGLLMALGVRLALSKMHSTV